MKICFYTDSLFTFGGVQRVLSTLAKELSKEHDITILTLDHPSLKDTSMYDLYKADIEYLFIKLPRSPFYEYIPAKLYSFLYKTILPQNKLFSKWYGYSSFPRTKRKHLINALNKGKYDIVVGVHVFLCLYLASIKHKLSAKVIGWMHSSYDAFFLIDSPYIRKLRNYFKHMIPNLDDVVVLTYYDQKKYLDNLEFRKPPIVIYNPLTNSVNARERVIHKTFLGVGRLSPFTKGFDILIQAFASFVKMGYTWNLVIVGEGPEKLYLDSLIKKFSLEERVTINPFTKNIEEFYKKAGVFILSSRWEGMPLVLLEAMSYGLPIITSSLPVTKELLQDEDICLFFQNGNVDDLCLKMVEIAEKDDMQLLEMGDNAAHFVNIFSIDNIILQWNDLLISLKEEC